MKCFECENEEDIHMHHVVPRSLGGTKMIALCSVCHAKVHGENLLKTSALIRKVMQEKKARGERVSCSIPLGFRVASDGKLVVDADEMHLASRCRTMKESGMTLAAIADILNEQGVQLRQRGFHAVRVHRLLGALK
jgi:hypothetical protein